MKRIFILSLLILGAPLCPSATPTSRDLVGRWDGMVAFGKIKFRMNLKIVPSPDGKAVKATLDNPDQGMNDLPIAALLFNPPDVRIEIDQFAAAFNGTLSADGTSIAGQFDEGPGGRAVEVTFKKRTRPDAPEPEKVYTFKPGETKDARGYWKGSVEIMPGTQINLGLRIGLLPDGQYDSLLDIFEQGAKGIQATEAAFADGKMNMHWELLKVDIRAKLSEDANELSGIWCQGTRDARIKFARQDKPATALPAGISFLPEKGSSDPRGEWKGVIEAGANRLRLLVKLGKSPGGEYAGTLTSLDQGGQELLASSVGFTNPVIRFECKLIRGIYVGTLNKEGSEIEGTWEQFGTPMPLKLERAESKPE